jgi:dihydrofolate reductase
MRKLIIGSFVSLDGVIDKPWEWIGNFFGPPQVEVALEELRNADYFLMARKTYERFSSTWPMKTGMAYFDRLNEMDKLVASTTLSEATWKTKVIRGDVAGFIKNLKQEPGKNIVKYGVGELDRALLDHGLIDTFKFSIIPITVGHGRRLFESIDMSRVRLQLTDNRVYDNGIIDLTYKPVYQ